MNNDQLTAAFVEEVLCVAPDLTREDLTPAAHLQQDLGLDSMDVLNLVAALHARLGLDIPEVDYPQIATLGLAVAYLAQHLPEEGGGPGP